MADIHDLTLLFLRVKDELENPCLIISDREICMVVNIMNRVLPQDLIDRFLVSPTSGDCHEPEVLAPPLLTGKAAEDWSPSAASTRQTVIDKNPHNCEKCGLIILPGEKYHSRIKKTPQKNGGLPKAEYEAEHVEFPRNKR